MAATVRVRGLRELNRDFGKLSKKLQRELQHELRKLAEPVARDIRGRASAENYGAATVAGIAAGTRSGAAVVRQRRRKTTGQHPSFGGLQMREAFIPGLEAHEGEIVLGVEHFLSRITAESGLGLGGML